MRYFQVFLILIFYNSFAVGQCSCNNCPVTTINATPVLAEINVSGATNSVLGANGQYLKSVNLQILSEGISELEINLYSPSGDLVTISTDNGDLVDPTFDFDICIVSCDQAPIPDGGFSDFFDSSEPWVSNTPYSGSYYPIQSLGPPFNSLGCLETLTGSVNGTWILEVIDSWPVTSSTNATIVDWSLEFEDNAGTSCISNGCNVGAIPCDPTFYELLIPSPQEFCQGDPALDLSISPVFAGVFPDPAIYGVRYFVVNALDLIVVESTLTEPDLTSYPSGDYFVCTMQYLLSDVTLLPPLAGGYSYNDIADDIGNGIYCAFLVCNAVLITPDLPNVDMDWDTTNDLCTGILYTFNVLNFDPTATYITQINSGGFSQFTFNNGVLEIIAISGPLDICVGINNDCNDVPDCKVFNVIPGPELPIINAPIQECLGATFTVNVVNSPLAPTYNWSISGPGTIDVDNNSSVDVTSTGLGTITLCANASSPNCGMTTDVCVDIVISNPPAPVILADPTYCIPGGFLVGNANGGASSTTYTQVSGPGTIVFNNPNVVTTAFTVDLPGTYTIMLTKIANGCTVSTTATFDILDGLALPILDGPLQECVGTPFQIDIINTPLAPNYNWTISGPGTIDLDNNTNVIVTGTGAGTVSVCATPSSPECGTGTEECFDITIVPAPSPPTLNEFNLICIENTFLTFVTDVPLASSYNWTVTGPASFVVNSIDEIDVTPTGLGIITICATAEEPGCGISSATCFDVEVVDPALPLIDAEAIVCIPGSFITGTLNDPTNSVTWEVIGGPGNLIFNDPFNINTSYTVDATGTYQISLTENNPGCVRTDFFTIEVLPELEITTEVTCNGTDFTIEITFENGSPPYLVFGTPISGNVYTSPPYPAGSAVLTLYEDNVGCEGQFFVQEFCTCFTDAGTMDPTPIEICGMFDPASGIHNANATFDANDIGSYVLHDSPTNILGTILQQNGTGVFSFLPPMILGQTYYISYIVGNDIGGVVDLNDPCLSVAIGQSVVWNEEILVEVVILSDPDPCDFSLSLIANTTPNVTVISQSWTQTNTPPGGTINFLDPSLQSTELSVNIPGTYTVTYNGSLNGCAFTNDITFIIDEPLAIVSEDIICSPDGATFNVNLVISGTPPILINGDLYNGTLYSSPDFDNGETYLFTITDANGCSIDVTDVGDCGCISDAGTMSGSLLQSCENVSVSSTFNNDAILDPNDIGLYVLHTSSNNSLGTIILENTTGDFGFDPTMVYGQTYYISYVVGNAAGTIIDYSDPCLSVSIGQPVVWYQIPTITLAPSYSSCNNTIDISASVDVGNLYTWSIDDQPMGSNPTLDNNNSLNSQFTTNLSGTYTVSLVANNQGCLDTEQTLIEVFPNVQIQDILESCQGQSYEVSFSILSGVAPFTINGTLLSGTSFTSNLIPSGDNYTFSVLDFNGCTIDIQGSKNCNCQTDAGSMDQNLIQVCSDNDTIVAIHNNNGTLDSDDLGVYILHTSSTATLGAVIDQNFTDGSFAFNIGMQYDSLYYISYVVGNSDGAGGIDLNDPCLDVAPGTPVIWYQQPNLNLNEVYSTCDDSLILIKESIFVNSNSYNWRLIDSPLGSGLDVFDLEDSIAFVANNNGIYVIELSLLNGVCSVIDTFILNRKFFEIELGVDTSICGLSTMIVGSISGTNNYSWSVIDSVLGSSVLLDPNDEIVTFSADIPGKYTLRLTSNEGECRTEDTIEIELVSKLEVEINEFCAFDNTTYTVDIQLSGGKQPYNIDGQNINGNLYQSQDIVSGMLYNINIADNSVCPDSTIMGVKNCDCPNGVSDIINSPISICEGDSIAINIGGTPTIPSGYLEAFVLHDGNQNTIGNVYGTYYTNNITYASNIPLDQVLYLTPLSGLDVGGTITIDGSCTLLGIGTTIIWTSNIDIFLNYPMEPICEGDTFRFDIRVVSPYYPISIFAEADGYQEEIIIASSGATYTKEIVGNQRGLFIFTSKENCYSPNSTNTFIIEREPCDCLTYDFAPIDSVCATIGSIDLTNWNVDSAEGVWNILSTTVIQVIDLQSDLLIFDDMSSGTITIGFTPSEIESCDTTYIFDLHIVPPILLELSTYDITSCSNVEGLLNLSDLLINTNISGKWTTNDLLDPSVFNGQVLDFKLLSPGEYTFTYRADDSQSLCDIDSVELNVNIKEALYYEIIITDPQCFGDFGVITIDIINDVGISTIGFDGATYDSPFSLDYQPGQYTIEIVDENLCTYIEEVEINQPTEITFDLLADNLQVLQGEVAKIEIISEVDLTSADIAWYANGIELVGEKDEILDLSFVDSVLVQTIITDDNGCIAMNDILLTSIKSDIDIVLPNIFNISSGGGNDVFAIPGYENIALVNDFLVYDRWGQLVFKVQDFEPKANPNLGWDGTMNGIKCEQGVYVYYISYEDSIGEKKILSGDITLIR